MLALHAAHFDQSTDQGVFPQKPTSGHRTSDDSSAPHKVKFVKERGAPEGKGVLERHAELDAVDKGEAEEQDIAEDDEHEPVARLTVKTVCFPGAQ